jgi:hypothetical protein
MLLLATSDYEIGARIGAIGAPLLFGLLATLLAPTSAAVQAGDPRALPPAMQAAVASCRVLRTG